MLVGLISDVHGHMGAFEAAMADLGRRADEILLAGDSMYEYRFCNEIVEEVHRLGIRSILGNHEAVMLGKQGERARSAPHVKPSNVERLAEVPWRIEADLGGTKLLMVHGSPFEPWDEYLNPRSPVLKRLPELEADVVVVGHTHQAMEVRVDGKLLVNPGSLGESRDTDRRGSYALLDTDTLEVEFIRLEG